MEDNVKFSHVDESGKARMVDVSPKPKVLRTATARGSIYMQPETAALIKENRIKKGDVLTVAQVAGIHGAKQTASLIPLCHTIEIDHVGLDFELFDTGVHITARAVCTDKTGIEMEALTAVSVAALTIYDMCKAVDKTMRISEIHLLEKTKQDMGKSFTILSINLSERAGEQKTPVEQAKLLPDHGIEGDAHAGNWHRQISLLADEDIDTMRGKGVELSSGDFAENITTRGVDLSSLPIGAKLYLGDAVLEVTQHGKKCHHDCAVFQKIGDCVMPRKGIFAKVIKGGTIDCESSCHYDI